MISSLTHASTSASQVLPASQRMLLLISPPPPPPPRGSLFSLWLKRMPTCRQGFSISFVL